MIGRASAFHKDDIPDDFDFKTRFLSGVEGWINSGDSVIVDPDGKLGAGLVREEETVLYGDIGRDQLVGPRWQLDTAGHYGRPDVFRVVHDRRPKPHLLSVDATDDLPGDGLAGEDGAP